ncbi:MAG: hypothetical protein RLZZ08_1419 [Pseudomonadota bacterium]|jgi:uncharacterized protein (DUF697 family)
MTDHAQVAVAEPVEVVELTPVEKRQAEVKSLIKKYAAISAGLGFIPVPGVDVASISGAQYSMIRAIANAYGYELSKERVRPIVSALVGGSLPVALAAGGASMVKAIPFVGSIAGAILVPSLASAATIALGRVFAQHFETGGTLLDLDADKLRAHYLAEFEAAKVK